MRRIRQFLHWILGLDDIIGRLERIPRSNLGFAADQKTDLRRLQEGLARIEAELCANSEVSKEARDAVVVPIMQIGL